MIDQNLEMYKSTRMEEEKEFGSDIDEQILEDEVDLRSPSSQESIQMDELKQPKLPNLVKINLNNCKYSLITDIATQEFLFRQTEGNSWDILWSDPGINQQMFKRMRLYQKVNHFPGMYMITRKNQLCHHLK